MLPEVVKEDNDHLDHVPLQTVLLMIDFIIYFSELSFIGVCREPPKGPKVKGVNV